MATAQAPTITGRWAKAPFYFNSAAHVLRIGRERANTLGEMLQALKVCPDASIFQHTFQTLREHHFIREGFSNDFAHWAFAACNEVGLAERLASIDVRGFTSIPDLRNRLIAIVEEYLKRNPRARDRAALEPFYFCASDTVVIPTPFVARNLLEFVESLKRVSIHSIHYHFIEARLRLKLNSNDFSVWLEEEMELGAIADRLNRIDIYTSTLHDVRDQILHILERAAQPAGKLAR
jgi:hypothetical protein